MIIISTAHPNTRKLSHDGRSLVSRHCIHPSLAQSPRRLSQSGKTTVYQAKQLFPRIRAASEVWITEAIFAEVGNALSALNRNGAVQFIQQCYRTENIRVVGVDTSLLMQALDLYQSRSDKTWGLTDCISFAVMQQQNLTDAVTADRHFVQAGFRALMLNSQ